VARKKEFVDGDSFGRPDLFARLRFQDAVDQEGRERMGETMKDLFQLFRIQNGIF
jgi:hypothetical protein